MTDFAPNFTARYRITYRSCLRTRTLTVRYDPDSLPGGLTEIAGDMATIFDELMPYLPTDFAILSASVANRNEDFFLPALAPVPLGTPNPLLLPTLGQSPNFLSFSGITAQGNTTRMFFYGVQGATVEEDNAQGNDYRITPSENGAVQDIITLLATRAWWVGSDGNPIFQVYQYANFGKNSYWQRKARRG